MATPRYPPIKPSDLTPEQKPAHDLVTSAAEKVFGDIRSPPRPLHLPPLPLPPLLTHFTHFSLSLMSTPGLSPSLNETIILSISSFYSASYPTYAHSAVAVQKTSLSKEQGEKMSKGEKPGDLGEEEGLAWDLARELVQGKGGSKEERWKEGEGKWGREGMGKLVLVVGWYGFTAILCNGGDVGVPGEKGEGKE